MSEDDLQEALRDLEQDLLDVATLADEAGATLLARNMEIWGHQTARVLSRFEDSVEEDPGTIADYLDGVEGYERPDTEADHAG